MSDLLDKTEASLLLSYEAVIEKGLDTFLEVGTALKAIADGRLYRERHKTFDAYLDARWNMTRSWASRLIQAAEVVEMLPIGNKFDVTSESQARELAKAPQGKRAETLAKAKESAKSQGREKPTAKDIREAVEQGNGTTPTHDATCQDDAEPRMADMDGDNGPCPQGGDHDIFTLHGARYCGRCKTRFGADDDCDDEPSVMIGSIDPANAEEAYDTTSLDDFCQWTIDKCDPQFREQLADRLQHWAKQARGVK